MESIERLLTGSRISPGLFRTELEAAFAAWSRAINIAFVPADNPADAGLLIGIQKQPRGRAYTDVAHGARAADGTSRIRRSLICLNAGVPWKVGFDGNADVYDLRYTLIHEIGHAIGLDHPGPSGQIMSFQYHEEFRMPQNGDLHGARLLYGRRGGADTARAGGNGGSREAGARDAPLHPASDPRLSLGEEPADGRAE